jgi:hypothetical protein
LRCPTPCDKQNDVGFRIEGDNSCPIGRWQAFKTFVKNPNRLRGLGDIVAAVAEPLAAASDKILKTKIKGCSGCAKRREMLNHLIPFGQRPPPK